MSLSHGFSIVPWFIFHFYPSPAWIAAARGKARGFAGEARSLLASEKNLLITPPKTIKNAQGFAGMVDPRTRPVISRFPYVYIYIYVCVCGNWSKWESAYYRCLHNSDSTIGNTKYGNGLRIFALIDLLEISWKRMTAASRNRKAEKHKSSEAGKTKSKKAGKQKREKQEKQRSRKAGENKITEKQEKQTRREAEKHRNRKNKRANKQKSREVEKQRSRNSRIQRKYLNLPKRNLKSIALHKKGLQQKHGPKIKPHMYVWKAFWDKLTEQSQNTTPRSLQMRESMHYSWSPLHLKLRGL